MDEVKNPAPCPFNGAVVCLTQIFCDGCGWNPKVSEERLQKIKQDLKKRGDLR